MDRVKEFMKILAVIGSPRKSGNSSFVIDRIEEKMKKLGEVQFERIYLSDASLEPCKGCGVCILRGEENCPNKDDRKKIEDAILDSDGVIFISPVYAVNMTALMKNFLDRTAYTMHRPRFFNQYTMLVSVTGAIGLKETIDSMKAIKYSGYNIVSSLGVVAPEAFGNKINDAKILKKIDSEAEKFYNTIRDKKPISPSFDNIMQFRMQQGVFLLKKDDMPVDYNYFLERGWLDKKKKFNVKSAKINPLKNLLAKVISSRVLNKI